MDMSDDQDVQKLGQILDIVADKVPALVNQLKASLFSAEAGRDLGQAVGSFYKELVASGIPEADALDMAKSYIGSLQNVMKDIKVGD
jgi:hypothetical protein